MQARILRYIPLPLFPRLTTRLMTVARLPSPARHLRVRLFPHLHRRGARAGTSSGAPAAPGASPDAGASPAAAGTPAQQGTPAGEPAKASSATPAERPFGELLVERIAQYAHSPHIDVQERVGFPSPLSPPRVLLPAGRRGVGDAAIKHKSCVLETVTGPLLPFLGRTQTRKTSFAPRPATPLPSFNIGRCWDCMQRKLFFIGPFSRLCSVPPLLPRLSSPSLPPPAQACFMLVLLSSPVALLDVAPLFSDELKAVAPDAQKRVSPTLPPGPIGYARDIHCQPVR